MSDTNKPLVLRCLTKKRYTDFKTYLENEKELSEEIITRICYNLCEIFEYNPTGTTYTKEKGKQHSEWRKKKAEDLGISIRQMCKGVKKLQIQKYL